MRILYDVLTSTHPDLLIQWDYEKNTITPDNITAGSGKKIWWFCKNNHSYDASVSKKTSGRGCPYCSGYRIGYGNDLKSLYPELTKQWDYEKNTITPDNITAGSGKKVWWICEKKHSYDVPVNDRTRGGGCPYCSSKRIGYGNDLKSTDPELAKRWHPTKNIKEPSEYTSGSNKKVWWVCSKGHEWKAMVISIKRGSGCPYCSNNKIGYGNDLLSKNPLLCKEWNFKLNKLKPEQYAPRSNKKVWWTCSVGHEWYAIINNRNKGHGCPYCCNQLVGYSNDLQNINPELAKQWHPTKNGQLKPTQVIPGSNEKVWWLCSKGHEWKAVINSRKKHNCPKCFDNTSFTEQAIFYYISQIFPDTINRKIISIDGINKEADVFIPVLKAVIEYDGFHHLNNHDKDLEKANFFLDNDYLFFSIRTDTIKKIDNNRVLSFTVRKGKEEERDLEKAIKFIIDKLILLTDIKDNFVDINLQRDSIEIYNHYILEEQLNSFASTYEEIAKEWHPTLNGTITPQKIRPKSHKKFWWLCKNNHHYLSSAGTRARGRGCPYCVGKKIGFGNDFESNYPVLSKEWNFQKNIDFSPSQFYKQSGQIVWWICSKGHEWEARISSRANGNGCVYCANRKEDMIMIYKQCIQKLRISGTQQKTESYYQI
jgi:very-short-patch-repair endonuclease